MRIELVAMAAQIEILQEAHQKIAHDVAVYFDQCGRYSARSGDAPSDTLIRADAEETLKKILKLTADVLAKTNGATISSVEDERREWATQNGMLLAKLTELEAKVDKAIEGGDQDVKLLDAKIHHAWESIKEIKEMMGTVVIESGIAGRVGELEQRLNTLSATGDKWIRLFDSERNFAGRRHTELEETLREIKGLHLRNAEQIEAFVAEFNQRIKAVRVDCAKAIVAHTSPVTPKTTKKRKAKVKRGRPQKNGKKRRPAVKQTGGRSRGKKSS